MPFKLVKDTVDPIEDVPKCNTKTIQGCMTERGCAFAGVKGLITGDVKDVVHVVHSPVGCTTYGCGSKRYLTSPDLPNGEKFPVENFNLKYIMGTDFKESDVVFGGMKKLRQSILETAKEFPYVNAIYTYATCTNGLIGDDMDAVAKELSEEIGKDVIAFNAPGFSGPTQSKGHHVGNLTLFNKLVGTKKSPETTPYDINLIGEYNIDGDLWVLKPYFEEMGINNEDEAILESSVGELTVKVIENSEIRKDYVLTRTGGWLKYNKYVNALTEDMISELGNGTPYNETFVRLKKLE